MSSDQLHAYYSNTPSQVNPPFTDDRSLNNKQWSIQQANSRLRASTGEAALENDLINSSTDDVGGRPYHDSIPLHDFSSRSNTNPYFNSGVSAIQLPQEPAHKSLRHKTYGFQDPFDSTPIEAWKEMKDYNLQANGLPTLDQMMRLHTYSPLTQSNFDSFLRERNANQNLNFLMELDAHDKLWKAYVSSVDRQNRQRLSRFLESAAEKDQHLQQQYMQSNGKLYMMGNSESYIEISDTDDLLNSASPMQRSAPITVTSDLYASRTNEKSLSRHDLLQSATRIYRTYCLPMGGSAQNIHLPEDHREALRELIEVHQRPEPIVFDSAREHVFSTLDGVYYEMFLDQVLHKNILKKTSRVFLVIGALSLILAFSIELGLIFLAFGSSMNRWIPILAFFFGWSMMYAGITEFSWWYGIFSISEIYMMTFSEVQDVTVKKRHRKRGWILLACIILLSLFSTVFFAYIPGHRL